jgi:hypothetical protein
VGSVVLIFIFLYLVFYVVLCCVVLCVYVGFFLFLVGFFFDNVSSAYDELLLKPSSDISKVKRYDSQIMSMFWGHE